MSNMSHLSILRKLQGVMMSNLRSFEGANRPNSHIEGAQIRGLLRPFGREERSIYSLSLYVAAPVEGAQDAQDYGLVRMREGRIWLF
jgi:hypothetical protein